MGSEAGRSWRDCRPKLTEAKPKHTLFGSTLEQQEKSSKLQDDLNLEEFTQSIIRSGNKKSGRRSTSSVTNGNLVYDIFLAI